MRKPDLYVVARFLDVLFWNRAGMKKTPLQMAVRLNYQTFLDYLEWLREHGLVKLVVDDDGTERIMLSAKGIEAYEMLVKWIKEVMKDLKI
ncbi:MAG: winged helix-turn-helix domain-containing protein [Candidatus Bathyarchaeia archaeon]